MSTGELETVREQPPAGGLARFLREARAQLAGAESALSLATLPEMESADVEVRPAAVINFTGDTEADTLFAAGVWARTAKPRGAVIQSMTPAYVAPARYGELPKFRISVMISVPDAETGETDDPPLAVADSDAPIEGPKRAGQ